MKSDFFVFYIAHLYDRKQSDFWEQGQNPAMFFGVCEETGPWQQEEY